MKLLSKELVSLEYREHLQRDLAKARVCRFLVAYISNDGMESVGRHLLSRALRDERSFGVGSLTCSCSFEPLLRLQSELPQLRLKYFMDPLVKEEGEPSEISLFHSKLVYLLLEREGKSVVYIGSHNWNRRALGPQGPRNAEASMRFEMDFLPEDLDGTGTSVASNVNRHLLDAWNMPLCLVWRSGNRLLVLVWESESDLASAQQPVMLLCRITTSKAGIDSRLRGTNQSTAPVAGFEAVIWDDDELAAQRNSQRAKPHAVRLWTGRDAQVYGFDFPTPHADSSRIDGTVRPKYQFHLEVERVIVPATGDCNGSADFVWEPESFSVTASREAARVEETPGYFVDPDRKQQIIECMSKVLLVHPEDARVLPYSSADHLKVGKRILTHPLHETFLGPEWKHEQRRDEYYEKSERGALVADLGSDNKAEAIASDDHQDDSIPRLQRVFTSPLDELVEGWSEVAKSMHSGKKRG